MTLKVRYRGAQDEYTCHMAPVKAAMLFMQVVPPRGRTFIEVVDEKRQVMWVYSLQELKEQGRGELADKWGWWMPTNRPSFVLYDETGHVVSVGAPLGADEVLCDICNAFVDVRPVPLIGNMAVCPVCFENIYGVSFEEAGRRDGIKLAVLNEEDPVTA